MSNYFEWTRHPKTGSIEYAEWLDDAYGRHCYGVRFPSDGLMLDARSFRHEKINPEDRVAQVEIEKSKLELQIGELLAVIHGDGGHHTGLVGLKQSIEDAIEVRRGLVVKVNALEKENKNLNQMNEELMALSSDCIKEMMDMRKRPLTDIVVLSIWAISLGSLVSIFFR